MSSRTVTSGAHVRAARIAAGLSVAELSRVSGVPPRTIYRVEAGGRRGPHMGTLRRLAAALGCAPADLLVTPAKDVA